MYVVGVGRTSASKENRLRLNALQGKARLLGIDLKIYPKLWKNLGKKNVIYLVPSPTSMSSYSTITPNLL